MLASVKKFYSKLKAAAFFLSFKRYARLAFSQEGEDLILARILENREKGFYVDVGAHHPFRFSNTFYFYLRGWRGINIDPNPGSMVLFNKLRKNDINLELAVSDRDEILKFYQFNEPALNTFSEELAYQRMGLPNYKIINIESVKTVNLASILDRHLPENQIIDFLSIDVEGFDYSVLNSNNWGKYKPIIILVEDYDYSLTNSTGKNKIFDLLTDVGYVVIAKTANTIFYKLQCTKQ